MIKEDSKVVLELKERTEWIRALFVKKTLADATDEEKSIIMGRQSVYFTLLSTFSFIVSFYIVQTLITLFQIVYLKGNGVNFVSTLQRIRFLPGDQDIWDETMIFIAYGLPYLISLILGGLLLGYLSKEKKLDWRVKHFLIWLSIHAIMQFAGGAAYATLFYDGFGVAYLWLFSVQHIRISVTFFILLILFATGSRWMWLFFRASPSRLFIGEPDLRHKYIWYAVLIPWSVSSVVIMLFFYPPANKIVFIMLFCYLLIINPMLRVLPLMDPGRLVRSNKVAFSKGWIAVVLVAILILLRFVVRFEFY